VVRPKGETRPRALRLRACARFELLTPAFATRHAQGEFTKTASQRAPANTGFATGIDKPRVHKDAIP
jgi:hypothetical protein